MDPQPADTGAPFVWLCRRCRLHATEDFSSEQSAIAGAERHADDRHPGRPRRFVVIQQFARCQWRRRFFSRICGASASWAHAPMTQVHLCEVHRAR